MGLRGGIQSTYYALRHGQKVGSLRMGRRVISRISSRATLDLQSPLLISVTYAGASHPQLGGSKFSVESDATVRSDGSGPARIGPCSVLHVEGEFEMGGSYINSHSRIICSDRVSIGDGCAIAWNVEIIDTDRHQVEYHNGQSSVVTSPIAIEDNVWIGHDVLINKGVRIGEGSVIAAGSIVTDDIPPQCLAAGTPAEPIRQDISWSE